MERPESHHQLQDPSPQHWGQSTTDWRPEQFLLLVSKTKAWSDTPHPLWPSHNTAINTLPLPPYCFSACNQDLWRRCKQSLQETEDKESQRPRRCLSSLPQSLCCSAIIHLHCYPFSTKAVPVLVRSQSLVSNRFFVFRHPKHQLRTSKSGS